MSAMTKSLVGRLVPDQLWALVEPQLPPAPRHGRRRVVPDRSCFAALVFMCRTSTPWALLPAGELGCGSATTAWRRLRNGSAPGCSTSSAWCCWTGSARPAASTLAGSASTRPACARSKGGAHRRKPCRPRQAREQAALGRRRRRRRAARRTADRGEHSGRGAAGGIGGRSARDPHALGAAAPPARQAARDKAYDSRGNRRVLRDRGIVGRIARRGVESSQRLGWVRWKAERTIAWLLGCRRLRMRYERSDARFYAFLLLACSLLSFYAHQQPPW
jgi:transposase